MKGAFSSDLRNKTHRYCVLCDAWYLKGTFQKHKQSRLHQVCFRASMLMYAWYQRNGA